MLEDEGVLEHVEIGEYHLGLIPFESDMLSLELDGVFRQCYVDGDTSLLNSVARALCRIQSTYGVIPNVKSKGAAAKKVLQKLMHFRREEELANPSYNQSMRSDNQRITRHEIDTLVLYVFNLWSSLFVPVFSLSLKIRLLSLDSTAKSTLHRRW